MKNKLNVKKITIGALLLSVALLLPQAFHFTMIPQVGQVFLPMHIPIFLAGFILGPVFGLILGIISPIISFLFTNMPLIQRLPYMIIELSSYGFLAGLLYRTFAFEKRTFGIYKTLILSMIFGRLTFFIALAIAQFLNILAPGFSLYLVIDAIIMGTYGIIIQLIIIPIIIYSLKRSGYIDKLHR